VASKSPKYFKWAGKPFFTLIYKYPYILLKKINSKNVREKVSSWEGQRSARGKVSLGLHFVIRVNAEILLNIILFIGFLLF
jgi:hypothetical protein